MAVVDAGIICIRGAELPEKRRDAGEGLDRGGEWMVLVFYMVVGFAPLVL